jgi:hypothetical protein
MTVAMLIENLQALPRQDLPVMVFDELFNTYQHVVLAEIDTLPTPQGEVTAIRLFTNDKDI